jgi:hypothetical protein
MCGGLQATEGDDVWMLRSRRFQNYSFNNMYDCGKRYLTLRGFEDRVLRRSDKRLE